MTSRPQPNAEGINNAYSVTTINHFYHKGFTVLLQIYAVRTRHVVGGVSIRRSGHGSRTPNLYGNIYQQGAGVAQSA